MTVKEWLAKTSKNIIERRKSGVPYYKSHVRPELVCKDGEMISVQASEFHLCEPQEILENGNYESVEIYTHGETFEEFLPYMNEHFICKRVDIDTLEEFVKNHGGIEESYE